MTENYPCDLPAGTYDAIDPVVREPWLTALESGTFGQTRGTLRFGRNYCCLGVLCEVALELNHSDELPLGGDHTATIEKGLDTLEVITTENGVRTYSRSATLPEKMFGLSDAARRALMGMNDDLHLTFPEIAAAIRATKQEPTT